MSIAFCCNYHPTGNPREKAVILFFPTHDWYIVRRKANGKTKIVRKCTIAECKEAERRFRGGGTE
jgi:hypothetical protein